MSAFKHMLGTAHLPGTGPHLLICGDCRHFSRVRGKDKHEPGVCRKWEALMQLKARKEQRIRPSTPTCKYFELP